MVGCHRGAGMSIKARYSINTTTFTFAGEVVLVRWTYERDEDDVYPIPVGARLATTPEYNRAMWEAIHAAAATTPPVRV